MDIKKYKDISVSSIEALPDLLEEKKKTYNNILDKITARENDPNLNVALIGEFSTGKSTFINAFIGQNILKTAWLATTALATKIFYRPTGFFDKYDGSIVIYAEAKNGSSYCVNNVYEKIALEKILEVKIPSDIKECIRLLSTDNKTADKLNLLELYVPNAPVLENVCIIDTPGVNPGADDTREHINTTRNVLREYADATLILFPALQVYTSSFNEFLSENAVHFLNEAIFIVTQMDLIEESGRDEIISFVKNNLTSALKVESPKVYGCSAIFSTTDKVAEENIHWVEEFDVLRKSIVADLSVKRKRIIEKQLAQLFKELMTDLRKEVEADKTLILKDAEVLENHSPKKLESTMQGYSIYMKQRIEEHIKNHGAARLYDDMIERMKTRITDGIFSCEKKFGSGGLRDFQKNTIPIIIEQEKQNLNNAIYSSLNMLCSLRTNLADLNRDLFGKFNLELTKKVKKTEKPINNIIDLSVAKKAYKGLNRINLNVSLFSTLSGSKVKAGEQVKKALEKAEAKNKTAFVNKYSKLEQKILRSVEEVDAVYISEYKRIYKKAEKEYESNMQSLKEKIRQSEALEAKLKQALSELEDFSL